MGWVQINRETLKDHHLCGPADLGQIINQKTGLQVAPLPSKTLETSLNEGQIDVLILFWDALEPAHPSPEVKIWLKQAALWKIPVATSRASADFLIAEMLLQENQPNLPTLNPLSDGNQ